MSNQTVGSFCQYGNPDANKQWTFGKYIHFFAYVVKCSRLPVGLEEALEARSALTPTISSYARARRGITYPGDLLNNRLLRAPKF